MRDTGDTVMDVVIETDSQFVAVSASVMKCPTPWLPRGARPEAHIPFAHSCARSQFGRVVVEGNLGVREHHEEAVFLAWVLQSARPGIIAVMVANNASNSPRVAPPPPPSGAPDRPALVVVRPEALHEGLHQRTICARCGHELL